MTPEQLNFVAYANGFQEGFQMTLDNGITVSIAFGARNYCDRGVRTCETAMWDARGNYIHYKGDDVQGYQTPADVLTLLSFAAALPMGDD